MQFTSIQTHSPQRVIEIENSEDGELVVDQNEERQEQGNPILYNCFRRHPNKCCLCGTAACLIVAASITALVCSLLRAKW